MRVLMLEPAARQQHAALDQRLDHGLVGVAFFALVVDDALAFEARRLIGQRAVFVDGIGDGGVDAARFQLARIRHPDVEVLAAVAGRGVHEAGAGVVGDVVAGKQRNGEFVTAAETPQGVRAFHYIEGVGRNVANLFIGGDARLLEYAFRQRIRQDQKIARPGPVVGGGVRDLVEAIGNFRRKADGAVAGQGPGRGGPDHDGGAGECAMHRRRDRKLHPHSIARVILVFDLGFGERGLLHHAPHHRLGAAIERAVGRELHQLARDLGLGEIIHGGVAVIPVPDDAEPLEFLALHVEPMVGIGPAFAAERHHCGGIPEIRLLLALGAVVLLLDLPFDRQAVAVPARHVIGIEAEHLLALGHHVLEDLVQRMPDMDVAVGVRRPVMQHEFGAAGGRLAQFLVEADLVPALEDFRLALRQAGAHREFRLRQEQGLGIVVSFRFLGFRFLGVGFLRLVGHECSGLARRALNARESRMNEAGPGFPPSRSSGRSRAANVYGAPRKHGLSIAAGRGKRKAPAAGMGLILRRVKPSPPSS